MKRSTLVVCLMAASHSFAAPAPQQQFEIDAQILSLPTSQVVAVTAPQLENRGGTSPKLLTRVPTEIEFSAGNQQPSVKLHLGKDGLDRAMLPKDVVLQAAPRVTTVANQTAKIMIVQYPQYMEKQSDVNFQLRWMRDPDWVGVAVQCKLRPVDQTDNTVLIDSVLEANWIQSRETIDRVSLDVGKPVIVHNRIQVSVSLDSDQWCLVTPPQAFGAVDRSMMLLFKVRRINALGQPIDASGRVIAE